MATVIPIDAFRRKAPVPSAAPVQPPPAPKGDPELEAITREMRKSLQPTDAIEEMMFQRIVHATWRIRKLERLTPEQMTKHTVGFYQRAQESLRLWSVELRKIRQRKGRGQLRAL